MLFEKNSLFQSIDLDNIKLSKCWFILREDIDFTSDRLFRLGIQATNEEFHIDNLNMNSKVREKWIKQGSRVETRMMFNINFLYKLEDKLINDGLSFKWVYSNKTTVGILVEPNTENLEETYLNDCMSLVDFSKFRLKQYNELDTKSKI